MPDPTLEPIVIPISGALPAGVTYVENDGTQAAGLNTLPLTPSATTRIWVMGFMVWGLGATAASQILINLNNVAGAMNFPYEVVAGVTTPCQPLIVNFPNPIPGPIGATVQLSVPSFGAGNTASGAAIWGYRA